MRKGRFRMMVAAPRKFAQLVAAMMLAAMVLCSASLAKAAPPVRAPIRGKYGRPLVPAANLPRPVAPAVNPRKNWQPVHLPPQPIPLIQVPRSTRQWTAAAPKVKRDRAGSPSHYVLIGVVVLVIGAAGAVWRWRKRQRKAEAPAEAEAKPGQVPLQPVQSAVSLIKTMAPFSSAVKRLPEKAKISEAILKEAMVEPDNQESASPQSLPVFKVPEAPVGSSSKKIRVSRDPCTLERFTQIECAINAAVEVMLQKEFHLRINDWMMISNFWNSPARFSMPPLPLDEGPNTIEPCSLDEFVELQVAVNRVTEETLKQEFSLLDRDWLKIKHYWYARYPRSESLLRDYKQFKLKYQRSAGMTAA